MDVLTTLHCAWAPQLQVPRLQHSFCAHTSGCERPSADYTAFLSDWCKCMHVSQMRIMKSSVCCCVGCTALQQAVTKAGTYKAGTLQRLQLLAACINANAHATGHQEDTNSELGLGMYPVLSMFNHSCRPNLAHSSMGKCVPLLHVPVWLHSGCNL